MQNRGLCPITNLFVLYGKPERLTLAQLRQVLILITQDTLVQVLKLPRALVRVEKTLGLDPLLMSVPLAKLLVPIQVQLRQWQTVQAEIASPLQRPAIQNRLQWQRMIYDPGQSLPRLQFIAPLLEGHLCLYQVAQEMGMSLLEIFAFIKGFTPAKCSKNAALCQNAGQNSPCHCLYRYQCAGPGFSQISL